jgi:hypothetical protein
MTNVSSDKASSTPNLPGSVILFNIWQKLYIFSKFEFSDVYSYIQPPEIGVNCSFGILKTSNIHEVSTNKRFYISKINNNI